MNGPRSRQLRKAFEWLDKSEQFISVVIPAHIDLHTGNWRPPQFVDVYKDELDIYRKIYGNRLIEITK